MNEPGATQLTLNTTRRKTRWTTRHEPPPLEPPPLTLVPHVFRPLEPSEVGGAIGQAAAVLSEAEATARSTRLAFIAAGLALGCNRDLSATVRNAWFASP